MLSFAWKTFSRWQTRKESSPEEKKKKRETYHFMEQFRETFSRPIDPIRFVGLFDCVNSVPQFESAWMKRSRFPYTAKMSARTIRHAVAIDERRAKFRQDLISEQRTVNHHGLLHPLTHMTWHHNDPPLSADDEKLPHRPRLTQRASIHQSRFRPRKQQQHLHPIPSSAAASQTSVDSAAITHPRRPARPGDGSALKEEPDQDILEIWFAGQHGDVGGGWPLSPGENRPASDLPLIWMLREAQRAGLPLDKTKLAKSRLLAPEQATLPLLEVDGAPVSKPTSSPGCLSAVELAHLSTSARLHDSLSFSGGLHWSATLTWLLMENLPFRRMDLQPDGSWRPISWPLPRGEVRDIPAGAIIHGSVVRRMRVDGGYRPGNVIVGGGGRGIRTAPESAGVGRWQVIRERGDLVGEAVVRDGVSGIGKMV